MEQQLSFTGSLANRHVPLAERMRPRTLAEVVGQPQLTATDAPLRVALEGGQLHSCVLQGPPGSGKTTIALVLAAQASLAFEQLNAVTDGIAQLRAIIARAEKRKGQGEQSLLFIDEIARWNKAQQDALLPHVENGTVVLIGSTTEPVGLAINPALLSRLRVYHTERIGEDALNAVVGEALRDVKRGVGIPVDDPREPYSLSEQARELLLLWSDGDARRMLGIVERAAALQPQGGVIDVEVVERAAGERQPAFGADAHFALASALIKSIRGSDVDAAVYWLARMKAGGEDPLFVARRLVIAASEEVGVAASGALSVAVAGMQAVQLVGPPECWLNLVHVACYLATCPKSWASYQALGAAEQLIAQTPQYPVPAHLRNPTSASDREAGIGRGYVHASKPGGDEVEFLPPELREVKLYRRSGSGRDK